MLRYLEGLDALSEGRWADAGAIFDDVARAADRDGRPAMARGVALAMQGRHQDAVNSFQLAQRLGYPGREPTLWTYIIGRMANRSFGPGQGIQGPRSLGGGSFFSGVPGHVIQGGDDYPTDYASFLYYRVATPIGVAAEQGGSGNTPEINETKLEGARWFANRARALPDLAPALLRRAESLGDAGRFSEALDLIMIIRISYPDDFLAAALASHCWLNLGRPATARREATLALTGAPEATYALLRRSLSAGRLGRAEQARADLKLAAALDENSVRPMRQTIEKAIGDGARAGGAAPLRRELVGLTAGHAPDARVNASALALVRAVERERLYYDEFYAEQIRCFEEQRRKRPKDPGPLATAAAFLIDEARGDSRGEALEPGRALRPYRMIGDDTRDLRRALAVADLALAIDGGHVGALMQRARALSRLGDDANAEKIVAQVLSVAPGNPQALRLQGQFWIERANYLLGQAALLRAPRIETNTWRETRSDGVWEVTRTTYHPPTQSDQNRASQLEAQANQLLRKANSAIQAALDATQGTLEGDLLLGDVALSQNRWADAIQAARSALKRDPRSLAAHDVIVDALHRSGQRDRADEARSERANVVQTTAGWKLVLAWRAIERRDFAAATRLLVEAEALDAADGRIDALRGEIARLTNRDDEARAAWRTALALAEARMALDEPANGASKPVPPRDPLEFGLAIAMRERLAAGAPAESALAFHEANIRVAGSLPPGGRAAEMFTAMLPEPEAPPIPARRPRNMADWLVRSHVAAARILEATDRKGEALAEYRAAGTYAAPGGDDMVPNIADRRGNRQNSNFAVYATCAELGEALIVLGRDAISRRDLAAAQVYLQQAVAAPISREQRQEVNELQMQLARMYRR